MKSYLSLLAVIALSIGAFGQGQRFGDAQPVQSVLADPLLRTSTGSTPNFIVGLGPAVINFCNYPANGVPCTNKATTYTDITLTTSCSTATQIVLAGTTNCVANSDAYGNWGVWAPTGNYAYTVTYNNQSSGPFIANGSSTASAQILSYTVATLPIANAGTSAYVTDGTGASCTVGGGTTTVLCRYSGTAWVPVSGAGGSTPAGSNYSVQFNNLGALGGTATGLIGQMLVYNNAAAPGPGGPGIGGRFVSGTSDSILCDNTTTLLDRDHMIVYTSATGAAITLPQPNSTGCTGNFTFGISIAFAAAGNFVVTPTSSTITYVSGGSGGTNLASITMTAGQSCAFKSLDNANWFANCSLGGGVTGMTAGYFPRATSTTQVTNSLCDEGITTANVMTCKQTAGFTQTSGPIKVGSNPPSAASGKTAFGQAYSNGSGPPWVTAANVNGWYSNSSPNCFDIVNGTSDLGCATVTIGSGTSTTNGTAIASGVSQSQPTITITGATTTDVAHCSLNAAPVATWQTGIQLLPPVVTANTVTIWLSNPTAGSITPAAAVVRCTVTR